MHLSHMVFYAFEDSPRWIFGTLGVFYKSKIPRHLAVTSVTTSSMDVHKQSVHRNARAVGLVNESFNQVMGRTHPKYFEFILLY